ncbi:MAG: amidohydrolase family protein [Magnetospirillum sp.]
MINRRQFLAGMSALTLVGGRARAGDAAAVLAPLRQGYLRRIGAIKAQGVLPIIDIESSYNPYRIDVPSFVRGMDDNGIAVMALSVDMPGKAYSETNRWSDHCLDLVHDYPDHFLPVGNGGVHPAWTKSPQQFLEDQDAALATGRYALMGEFEFRHYPSPRQVERGELFRDVNIPIDGPLGEHLFATAQHTGLAFQIHYEIEDVLLPPLETMLARYPGAKVIWCHFAQIRYGGRALSYGPDYLRGLLERFPNLYVDTAFGGPDGVYQLSGERHAHYWAERDGWRRVIAAHPYRFLAALDIGGDRMDRLNSWSRNLRDFLGDLPSALAEIVAYKSAWKLLYGEDLPI